MKELLTGILLLGVGILALVAFVSSSPLPGEDSIGLSFLVLPVTFTGAGVLLLLGPLMRSRDYTRKRGKANEITAIAPRSVPDVELTPGEAVLMNATRYARRVRRNGVLLLDGETRVSEELLVPVLAAAFAANVKTEAIELRMAEWPNALGVLVNRLVAFPVGREASWPAGTLEAQLLPVAPTPVSEIVRSWLAHDSESPCKRGLEKAAIALTLRGLARIDFSARDGRFYRFAVEPAESDLAAIEPLARIGKELGESEPEIAAALEQAIRKGIDSRRTAKAAEVDPWLDEADTDREPFREVLDLQPDQSTGGGASIVVAAAFWLMLFPFLTTVESSLRILTWSLGITAAGALGYLAHWRLRRPDMDKWIFGRNLVLGAHVGVAAMVVLILGLESSPGLTLPVASVLALLFLARAFRQRVKARLAELVAGTGEPTVANPAPSEGASWTNAPAVARSEPGPATEIDAVDDLGIEIVDHRDLPEPSPEARSRVQAIRDRGLSIRASYASFVLILATGTVILAFAASRLEAGLAGHFNTTASLYAVTLFLFLIGKVIERKFRHEAQYSRPALVPANAVVIGSPWRSEIRSIRPRFFPLLGAIWFLFDMRPVPSGFAQLAAPWSYALVTAALGLPIAAYVGLRRARRNLERRYPVYPPLRLLALRVFGSTDLGAYVSLIDRWHWFGSLLTLEGPDTGGQKLRDFALYITGNIDHGIIRNRNQLTEALGALNEERDKQLRFSTESLQFDDASWREALNRILDRSHVVVMDLTGFSRNSGGCVYEITTLIDRLPLSRFILLINDSTDVEFLKSVIRTAWAERTPDSPNASTESPVLHLFRIGGELNRGTDETQLEWQNRLQSHFDRDRVVTMLLDAALSDQPADITEALSRPEALRWGAMGLPKPLRICGKLLVILILAVMLMLAWSGLTGDRTETAATRSPSGAQL